MPRNKRIVAPVVAASLLLAMILRILPLPRELFLLNPDWVLLFLLYWNMAIPDRVGVGTAWFAGLITDALTGRMLGQHALAYAVVAYVCIRLHRRLRLYPLYQQALSILLFQFMSQLLVFWTQNIKAVNAIGAGYWTPSLVGALAWPAVFMALRRIRRHFDIY
jgi:rod shape-determining protein MreD